MFLIDSESNNSSNRSRQTECWSVQTWREPREEHFQARGPFLESPGNLTGTELFWNQSLEKSRVCSDF